MAGRQLDVSVMVRLRDALTSPLAALQRRLSSFAALGSRIGAIGGLVASISFAAPIASAAEWDQAIRDIAVTAGLSGQAAETFITETGRSYERLALQVGQRSRDIAAAAGQLVAAGLDEGKVGAILPTLGRVSTASRAALTDVASTAFTLSSTLKIADDQMEAALTSLLVAAKAGNVEFRDMAKYLPSIGAAAANLGLSGREGVATLGAALEVVRMGAGDAATAANNLKNLLAKALSPDVSKNFAKFGVDIGGVMKDAAAKGIDPFEAMLAKVIKITGVSQAEIQSVMKTAKAAGMTDAAALEEVRKKIVAIGGAEKISQIFGDQQAIEALLPLLAHLDEYQGIRAKALSADNSVLAKDFATQMAALQKQLDRFGEIGEQAVRRVGKAFATNLPMINDGLAALLGWVKSIDETWPGLIDTTLSWAGAILMLIAGLAAAGPVLSIAAAGVGALGAILGAALTPIGIVVAALAGGAAIIVANWEDFADWFADLWGGIRDAFAWGARAVRAFFRGDLLAAQGAWRAFVASLSRIGASLGNILRGIGRQLISYLDQAGRAMFGARRWGEITTWAEGIYNQARDAIQAGDWGGLGRLALGLIDDGFRAATPIAVAAGGWLADQIKAADWAGAGRDVTGLIASGVRTSQAVMFGVGRQIGVWLRSIDWMGVGRDILNAISGGMIAQIAGGKSPSQVLADKLLEWDWRDVGRQIWNLIMAGIPGLTVGLIDGLTGTGKRSPAAGAAAAAGRDAGSSSSWTDMLPDISWGDVSKRIGDVFAASPSAAVLDVIDRLTRGDKPGAPARAGGPAPASAAAAAAGQPQETKVGGEITVRNLSPDTLAVGAKSSGPVGLAPADRGRVQGRF